MLVFVFPCWDIIKCLNASVLTTAVFELVQQFYHATEIDNVANGSALALISLSWQNKCNCFGWSELSRNTILKMRSGRKVCKNVVRWFLDADHNPGSRRNLIITFWPIYNVPWSLHANSFRDICIKLTNNKQRYAKTINLLCAGNKFL